MDSEIKLYFAFWCLSVMVFALFGRVIGLQQGFKKATRQAGRRIRSEVAMSKRWRESATDSIIAGDMNTHEAVAHWEGALAAAEIVEKTKYVGYGE